MAAVRPTNGGTVLVQSALLNLNLRRPLFHVGSVSERVCAVQLVEADAGIELACARTLPSGDDGATTTLQLDISHAVQAWAMNDEADKGLRLEGMTGWEVAEEPVILLESYHAGAVVRQRRDIYLSAAAAENLPPWPGHSDCPVGGDGKEQPPRKRCCRHHMWVNFSELDGFQFIRQPKGFDAFRCQGKCPPRYLPRNDHSLIQSLLHLKSKSGGGQRRIKKPCCSPRHGNL